KPTKTKESEMNFLDRFFFRFNKWFDKVSLGYKRGVAKWIKATPLVMVMMVCLCVGLFFLFQNKPTGFIPIEDEGRLFVTYEMPEATSTTRNVAMLQDIMKRIEDIPEIRVAGGL